MSKYSIYIICRKIVFDSSILCKNRLNDHRQAAVYVWRRFPESNIITHTSVLRLRMDTSLIGLLMCLPAVVPGVWQLLCLVSTSFWKASSSLKRRVSSVNHLQRNMNCTQMPSPIPRLYILNPYHLNHSEFHNHIYIYVYIP